MENGITNLKQKKFGFKQQKTWVIGTKTDNFPHKSCSLYVTGQQHKHVRGMRFLLYCSLSMFDAWFCPQICSIAGAPSKSCLHLWNVR